MLTAIIHGFVLAFGLILPLGVQNVFIFNQGAQQKTFVKALPAVVTASLCDTMLILLAVLGVSVVVLANAVLKTVLLGAGILFLIYMGFVIFRSKPASQEGAAATKYAPRKQILFAASVSLLNPHAILDTIGVIGTSSISYSGQNKWAFSAACIVVSWLWFTGLAWVGKVTGELKSAGTLAAINKVSALIIWGTALFLFFDHFL
ncbi:amino acid transporter [Bacillus sp. ISL-47]|uniref:LysE/ArgO family amino acid transporter n=1 Tax=Bacillus sp. ISL-47 TaxID=2819130 RepID=UPI001BE63785|nr:LysE/ArgO family amino acid transporter [Bacillus sp. ISL-47]MBT2687500.1 amino acid transporter [Bacillus sp. ISL-47]